MCHVPVAKSWKRDKSGVFVFSPEFVISGYPTPTPFFSCFLFLGSVVATFDQITLLQFQRGSRARPCISSQGERFEIICRLLPYSSKTIYNKNKTWHPSLCVWAFSINSWSGHALELLHFSLLVAVVGQYITGRLCFSFWWVNECCVLCLASKSVPGL